jgi:hypothetical protein
LLASPFRSPVPPCLFGNPPDCPWPIAPPPPPPPPPQYVCSLPIFNNYSSITNLWMQRQNTEPPGEDTVKHERSGGKSLKRKKKGPCSRCFSRPKHEGRRRSRCVLSQWNSLPLRTCPEKTVLVLAVLWVLFQQIFMFSIETIYWFIYLPHFEATSLGSSIWVCISLELKYLITLGNNTMFSLAKLWLWNVIINLMHD